MLRIVSWGVAVVAALVLTTAGWQATASPAAGGASAARPAERSSTTLELTRSDRGIQPGQDGLTVTAHLDQRPSGPRKISFKIKGAGATIKRNVRVERGRAVLTVPPLGTGDYLVKARIGGLRDTIRFEVYDSSLTLDATTFTFSAAADPATYAKLSGSVIFKSAPANAGFVDFYQNGSLAGGSTSPSFLGFVSLAVDGTGTLDAGVRFGQQITKGTGLAKGNLAAFGPGTYTFQAVYTDNAEYEDYIASQLITVVVVP